MRKSFEKVRRLYEQKDLQGAGQKEMYSDYYIATWREAELLQEEIRRANQGEFTL